MLVDLGSLYRKLTSKPLKICILKYCNLSVLNIDLGSQQRFKLQLNSRHVHQNHLRGFLKKLQVLVTSHPH